ncbi:hypothetical protein [Kangiella geojedonensis]|uniref:Rap1a immunity protein domain-containing protein n=1 Tax=Kangiella geojedonensis TaxID=914150 RepID=A0A0F6TNZ2_9GAMM|nr:hypothetical protein [Kangiella geojedonensis]AKE51279.1 hypothetical protein TQ33_0291 [Kangiella geojedonensis]
MIKKIVIGVMALLPLTVNAGSTNAKIERILFLETGEVGLVYVYPEGGVNNPPECHGANRDYISFDASRPMAKEYISGLMAAMMADKKLTLRTEGDCIDQGVSDTLKYFSIHKN